MIKTLSVAAGLLTLLLGAPAYAFPADGSYHITKSQMQQFCGNHGGISTGGGHSGCATVCGPNNSKICDVDCVGNSCTITISLHGRQVAGLRPGGGTMALPLSGRNGSGNSTSTGNTSSGGTLTITRGNGSSSTGGGSSSVSVSAGAASAVSKSGGLMRK
ncbi:MAG TPA: hypothetical protein VHB74_02475 [Devosia sp.]|nr:hypothetical protein [Devosia sp.]